MCIIFIYLKVFYNKVHKFAFKMIFGYLLFLRPHLHQTFVKYGVLIVTFPVNFKLYIEYFTKSPFFTNPNSSQKTRKREPTEGFHFQLLVTSHPRLRLPSENSDIVRLLFTIAEISFPKMWCCQSLLNTMCMSVCLSVCWFVCVCVCVCVCVSLCV